MAERIPQSTAYLVVFRAYLASDGKTPATGKTIAITISKNGAAFGNPNVGALNASEISSGFYKFTLDTTDTGTLGPLAWRGAEGSILDAGDVLNVKISIAAEVTTTAMTESYNADGAAPTPAQALMLILQTLTEFTISGTTYRINKLDGTTQAAALTLNDGTTPTAATRTA